MLLAPLHLIQDDRDNVAVAHSILGMRGSQAVYVAANVRAHNCKACAELVCAATGRTWQLFGSCAASCTCPGDVTASMAAQGAGKYL